MLLPPPDTADPFQHRDLNRVLITAIRALPPINEAVVRMCGLEKRTRQYAANELAIKPHAVSKIYSESIRMLKRWFEIRRLRLRDFA